MKEPTNAVTAWLQFLVNRIIVPVARHFNEHLGELEERNAQLTRRVNQLEERWEALAKALQPPFIISADSNAGARDVARAILRFVNNFKPRPDPLTLPTDPPPNAPGA